MRIFTPPSCALDSLKYEERFFLAGSIEMGKAVDWQREFLFLMEKKYGGINGPNVETCFYNPRRMDWDSTWTQSIENPQFYQQVSWEMDNLERATHILFNFIPGTYSPISLLELGLFAHSAGKDKNVLVICPEGFWRKGNVDIVCNRYNIPQETSIEGAVDYFLNH